MTTQNIKKIAIISGKGGTGKTFISASFAVLAKNNISSSQIGFRVQADEQSVSDIHGQGRLKNEMTEIQFGKSIVADCDVDAANLHLLLNTDNNQTFSFHSGNQYTINSKDCIQCGQCKHLCNYDAISSDYHIDPIACEGCGACYFVCPAKAITASAKYTGQYFISETPYGPFVHARLNIGEDNSGKLVSQVRETTDKVTKENNYSLQIIDGPPGIGCPVTATLTGIDLSIIVTEPTLSGIHDLERIIELSQHFDVPVKIIINKCDINAKNTKAIENYAQKKQISVIGKIPYCPDIIKSLVSHKIFIEQYPKHSISQTIKSIWGKALI